MAHLKIQPPGQVQLNPQDRTHIIKVIGGDSWHVSVNLYNPANPIEPAIPENTYVEIKLAETQFDKAIWTGEWFNGIIPDPRRIGLCHINVPRDITERLRRGSYMFSVRVSDILKTNVVTEAEGSFIVEYKVTSDQHSIPYKDGTGGTVEIPAIVEMLNAAIKDMDNKKVDKNALFRTKISVDTINGLRKAMVDIAKILGAKIEWPEE